MISHFDAFSRAQEEKSLHEIVFYWGLWGILILSAAVLVQLRADVWEVVLLVMQLKHFPINVSLLIMRWNKCIRVSFPFSFFRCGWDNRDQHAGPDLLHPRGDPVGEALRLHHYRRGRSLLRRLLQVRQHGSRPDVVAQRQGAGPDQRSPGGGVRAPAAGMGVGPSRQRRFPQRRPGLRQLRPSALVRPIRETREGGGAERTEEDGAAGGDWTTDRRRRTGRHKRLKLIYTTTCTTCDFLHCFSFNVQLWAAAPFLVFSYLLEHTSD